MVSCFRLRVASVVWRLTNTLVQRKKTQNDFFGGGGGTLLSIGAAIVMPKMALKPHKQIEIEVRTIEVTHPNF